MPIVTSISVQEKNKKRCNLFVDGTFYAGITLECALINRLKRGMIISQKELDLIVFESNKQEAFNLSIKYVSNSIKTKKQVKDYLVNKGYAEDIVWYCIDKLKEYNYVDDVEYCKRYIESVSKKQGRRLTEYKLMLKGVRKEDIESAYDECEFSSKNYIVDIAKKHFKDKDITKENLAKTYKYLIGKGFSYEDANYAISKLKEED